MARLKAARLLPTPRVTERERGALYANEMLMWEEACLEGSSEGCWRGVRVEGGVHDGFLWGCKGVMGSSWWVPGGGLHDGLRGGVWGGFVVASMGASWWLCCVFIVGS